jgi:hypothetical protein
MVRTFKYRLVKASWAIAIDITAEATFPTALPAKAVNIKDGLWLAIVPQWLSEDEQRYLTIGMTLVADSILAKAGTGRILVNVLDVQYNPCHYQSQGLAAALMGWGAEEFSFRVEQIPIAVDRARKRYIYKFWDSQTVALPVPVSGAMQAPPGESTPLTRKGKVAPVGLSAPTRLRFDFPVAGTLSRASVRSELAYPPRLIGGPPQAPFHNQGTHSLQTGEINGKNGS